MKALCITTFFLAMALTLHAQDTTSAAPTPARPAAPTQADLEAAFTKALTDVTFTGRWCGIKDGALTPEKEDKYIILGVTKVDGDNWTIRARIQFNKIDVVVPLPIQVKWAGDTAVICVTDLGVPGIGTYSARVVIYENTYAGTWTGKGHAGLLNGIITKTPKEEEH